MISRIASLLRIRVPDKEPGGLLIASGKAVPADGAIGYQPGCIFQVTAEGSGAVYVNEGTHDSCEFKKLDTV